MWLDILRKEILIRVRIRFQKKGVLRFLSHHDLIRLFDRAIRRAGIPIAMTAGFNPRPKMSFPLALALGIEGREEIVELGLDGWLSPKALMEGLKGQLPQELEITSVEPISPVDDSRVDQVVYHISWNTPTTISQRQIEQILASQELWVYREKKGRKKVLNLRPSITSITPVDKGLELRLQATTEGMLRPEEILHVLGLGRNPESTPKIVRSEVHLSPQEAN